MQPVQLTPHLFIPSSGIDGQHAPGGAYSGLVGKTFMDMEESNYLYRDAVCLAQQLQKDEYEATNQPLFVSSYKMTKTLAKEGVVC